MSHEKPKEREDEIDPFSSDERKAIISASASQEHNLIRFTFSTNMRISELCSFDWNVVDWLGCMIGVNTALTQHAEESEAHKTNAGIRDVKFQPGDQSFANPR